MRKKRKKRKKRKEIKKKKAVAQTKIVAPIVALVLRRRRVKQQHPGLDQPNRLNRRLLRTVEKKVKLCRKKERSRRRKGK